ncbi:MAG: acyl carrier protein [Magnetospirillum sp.]|nr:acyl carrier protein [Magnetospirillum sp.]
MDTLELDLKRLIVSALKIEDLSPEDIASDEPLFGDAGLGLDSIDALELGVAIRKVYGVKIETVSEEVRRHFANIRNLAQFIRSHNEVKP